MTNRSRGSWDQPPRHHPFAVVAAIALIACGHETTTIPRQPERISIAPQATSLLVGEAESFTAQAFDAKGVPTGASFSWSSSDPTVASVGKAMGVVTAISVGTATVTATWRTISGSATVTVLPPGPARLSTSTSAMGLVVGWRDRITAQVWDARDRLLAVPVEWSSSNPAVATVGRSDGVVTAIAVGTTTVSAKVGTLTTNVALSVIELAGSITLVRQTNPNTAAFTSEVLVYSTRDTTLTPLSRDSKLGSIAAPAWSPNGTLLAVEVIGSIFYDDYNHWTDYASDLYVLGAGPARALVTDSQSRAPDWSPDGGRIAFVKRAMQSPTGHIYVIGAAGGAPVRLTEREGSYDTPRWSPDGARLAFSDDIGGNRDVFIVNADGTRLTNLTANTAFDAQPSWSPDGTRLAFVSNRYGQRSELFVVSANGGNAERITSLGGWISAPVWSPDGRLIVFTLAASPNLPSGVYVMSVGGSSLIRLISTPAQALDLAFAWRAPSGSASEMRTPTIRVRSRALP